MVVIVSKGQEKDTRATVGFTVHGRKVEEKEIINIVCCPNANCGESKAMKCLLCTDDPDAEKSQKDWNKEMDEERLAHHIVKAHYVESLNLALYVAKLQYKIEFSHGPS